MNIGVLASGGDGAGMNMFLYTLVKSLKKHNITLFKFGYKGLIEDLVCDFDLPYLKSKCLDGGVCIKTSRCPEFTTKQGQIKALETLKKHNIDVLVVMGGNGSLKGAKSIAGKGVKIIFVPCSIDNDVSPSKYAIGFDTACDACVKYIKNVQDTMLSFDRLCIYEVMGRDYDAIAQKVGEKVDADYIYTDKSNVNDCVKYLQNTQKSAPIVILQENLVNIEDLANDISQKLNREVKFCVIGYFQRGGTPTVNECKFAKQFADVCVKQIKDGLNNNLMFIKYDCGSVSALAIN